MGFFSILKKSGKAKICFICNSKILRGKVGGYILDENKYLCCKNCQPKLVALAFPIKAQEEKRDMTIQELREFERLWNSKELNKALELSTLGVSSNEIKPSMPNNGKFYEFFMSYENNLCYALHCPYCQKLVTMTLPHEELKKGSNIFALIGEAEPSNPFTQAMSFLYMRKEIPVKCPYCYALIIAMK
jgi:hypothetical protein